MSSYRFSKGVGFGLATGAALAGTFRTQDACLFISTLSIVYYSFNEKEHEPRRNDSFGNGFFYGFVGSQIGAYAFYLKFKN